MTICECLEKLANDQKEIFSISSAAGPEDQLKPIFKSFFESFGDDLAVTIQVQSEVTLSDEGVRPDLAIYIDGLICGYIELKAPGLGADAPRLKGKHNKKQWAKLKALPNLIYTDGREICLYRSGERAGKVLRMDGNPVDDGAQAYSPEFVQSLDALIRDFILWQPIVPHKPSALAAYLAPLTKFLREEVSFALLNENSSVSLLAKEWRQFFFPNADDAQFADAYAQTVTYAMLLARLLGAQSLDPHEAAKTLAAGNNLLGRALELLGQKGAREDLRVGFELLQRSLEALDKDKFLKGEPDLWLYFYEDFLAAYDPKLRKDYGVYYTPREVVELQVRLVSELLETRFGKKLGFADDGVVFLDPAVGTGTYPVAAVKHALKKVEARSGKGAVAGRAAQMARNMYGFEILVGPYSVAHLRISQALESAGAEIKDRLNIYLADTLESPNAEPPGGLSLTYKALTEEHEAARKIKNEGDVLVCLGNPPYDRNQSGDKNENQQKGGWVRNGDQIKGAAKQEKQGNRPIFEDFLDPAKEAGKGLYLQVIYNDYVYFWRWALWRLFEQQKCGGIISFITASSFISGPGFVGMREVMRKTFDEIWIIDLGGDNLGTRKTPNVFNIQTPVAITIGISKRASKSDAPAQVKYTNILASDRKNKLAKIEKIEDLKGLNWQDCPDDWQAPFFPQGVGDFFSWPKVTELFPYHTAGAVFYRTWPIGSTREVLEGRWEKLVSAPASEKPALFKESRDRKIMHVVSDKTLPGGGQKSVAQSNMQSPQPNCMRYGFRAFDRQYVLYDFRLGDYIRPTLYKLYSAKQLFLVSLDSLQMAHGPAMTASANIPDQHHFCGRGGKDIIPLYRDAGATQPNITGGLLEVLGAAYGKMPTPEELASYVYAVLGGQSYTSRFWNELETPGPRVPITKDGKLFSKAAKLGRRLIWLHTYAERFGGDGLGNEVPAGKTKSIKGISSEPSKYPEGYAYIEDTKEIRVGDGVFGPVSAKVWEFEVSGLKVVKSWLGYRMKKRSGKKSSPLDDIRPERWTPKMTDEFLELLWVLEETLNMEPQLSKVLDAVVAGECFKADELPTPTEEERKPPKAKPKAGDQADMFA